MHNLKRYWLAATLMLFFVIILAVSLWNQYYFFDEAVYIGMSKYLYSFGESGFFEFIRPVLLPLITGLPLLFGWPMTGFAKVMMCLLALGDLILMYLIVKKIKNKKAAVCSTLILMITPLFAFYSGRILPHIPAIFLMLLAIYFFVDEKYWLTGIFSGLAFLIRFPYGLLWPGFVMAIFLTINKKNYKQILRRIFLISGMFVLAALPYLIFSYLTSPAHLGFLERILRPFTSAALTVGESAHIYNGSFGYYFINLFKQNIFFFFGIGGLVFLIKRSRLKDKNNNIIIILFLLMSFYFSFLSHKELRYALSFVPFVAYFSGIGMSLFWDYLRKKTTRKWLVILAVILLLIFGGMLFLKVPRSIPEQPVHDPALEKLLLTDKPIVSSSPFIIFYTDAPIKTEYYSPDILTNSFGQNQEAELMVIVPELWQCFDSDCSKKKSEQLFKIFSSYPVVYFDEINGQNTVVVCRNCSERIEQRDLRILYQKYAKVASLKPLKMKPKVAMRFDSIGENMEREEFIEMNDFFIDKGIPLTWGVIPEVVEKYEIKETIKKYYGENKENLEIAQFGFVLDLSGKSYEKQLSEIKKEREILENFFGTEITVFIPPQHQGDENTILALEELDYEIYASGLADQPEGSIEEVPVQIYYMKNWAKRELKSAEELKREFETSLVSSSGIVIEFSVYTELEEMKKFIEEIEDKVDFAKISEMPQKDNLVGLSTGEINLSGSEDGAELYVTTSGNYTIKGEVSSVKIVNEAPFEIWFCLNGECKKIKKEAEFNLKK